MGDGMLASFSLASYAVRCAQAILFETRKQDILLKIGIHEGEIVFEGNDVFGEGVNIASRLQESAGEGCISISGTVYDDIKNKADIKTEFIREQSFKNVKDPVKVYRASCDERSVREFIPEKLQKKEKPRKPFYARPVAKISSLILIIVAVLTIILFYSGTSLPFKEREWIVITDFENLTGESIFDNSLNTAFMLSINQSRYINVITRQRMMNALKRMKKSDIEYIDEETGREIALREGVKICIVPRISRVGTQYILTAEIQEAGTAEILRSEVLYAENQDGIIRRLDQLSKRIRRKLGESYYKILQQNKPLAKVTTASLDALEEYSLGVEKHINLNFEEAKIHYENAIRLDSNFTAAKASLGNLLVEKLDSEEGIEWLDQAIESIDNLTDNEKYGILAFYAANVEKDLDKAIEIMQTKLDLYPDDPITRNNLGWYYQNKGLYENAATEYKMAIENDPYMVVTYSGLIYLYLTETGQMDSAKKWTDKMVKIAPENPWVYFYLGNYYVAKNQLEDAEREYRIAGEKDPSATMYLYRLAHVLRLEGKYEEAVEVLNRIFTLVPGEPVVYYNLGIVYNLMKDTVTSKEYFLKHLEIAETWKESYSDYPETYIWIGCVLSRLGKFEEGWETGKKAIELDSSIHFDYARFLAVQGKKEEALDHLTMAFENGFRDLAWLLLQQDLQSLQHEPRFQKLISDYINL
jgi:tetratricopeptide (TPR) repeat protein